MWQKFLLVGTGGALGAVIRFAVSEWGRKLFPAAALPVGTFVVNVIGCLLIGLLGGLAESRNLLTTETRAFLIVGILGGLTTFSAFGYESFLMMRQGEMLRFVANIGLQLILGLVAVWAGFAIALSVSK